VNEREIPTFARWARGRVARAVEAGELCADAALALHARLAAARPARPTRQAVLEGLVNTLGVSRGEAGALLAALERLPPAARVASLRRTLEERAEAQIRAARRPRAGRDAG
jgi:hypothetical protein